MSVFSKRNLLAGITTLIIGIGASAAIWGVPRFLRRSTSINSQVTAYLLDDRGSVNGLLLASGDQLHFSPQAGEIVASQIKVGDAVTATGHAGSKSSYGREFRVEQIAANGHTIVEAEPGPPSPHGPRGPGGPGGPRDKRGPKDRDERPQPADAATQPNAPKPLSPQAAASPAVAPLKDANTNPTERTAAAVPAPAEIFKASGTIRTHLVNGRGDVDGLILSSGEQLLFSPRVAELILAAEQGSATQVSVEGTGVRNERGTVIRPTQITVGNQTIAVGRERLR
jgi:hypothetical protein